MTESRSLVLMAVISLAGLSPAPAAAVQVATPSITWHELLPYIASNLQIDPDPDGKAFHVMVADYPSNPSGIELYSRSADEFAKVLLFEAIATDKQLQSFITKLSKGSNSGPPSVQTLLDSPEFLSRIHRRFERALRSGNISCIICEKGFTLTSLEILN